MSNLTKYLKLFSTQEEYQAWKETFTGDYVVAAYCRYDNTQGEKEYEYSLTASMSQTTFEKTASTAILSIEANCSWDITTEDAWVHFDIVSGAGPAEVTVSIDATEEAGPRTGEIYVSYGDEQSISFEISQEGAGQPANQFWYKSNDGEIITPNSNTFFDANGNALSITSNTYVNGQGVITFSGNIAELGSDIFRWAGADRLIEASIPPSVTKIGGNAFNTCIFSAFTIPDSVVEIGQGAFMWTNIRELIVPASVQRIGGPCYQCQQLTATSIYATSVPEYLETPSYGYFGINKPINVPSNLVDAYKAASGWSYYANNIVGTLPPVPTEQPNNEIWYHTTDGEIAWDRFSGGVTNESGDTGYGYNGNLSNTYENGKGVITFSPDGRYSGSTAITKIDWLFNNCRNLLDVSLPSSLEELKDSNFKSCSSLTAVTFNSPVTKFGSSTFNGCTSLQSIELPESLTGIGSSTFNGCTSLQSIELPESLTGIGSSTFMNCYSLTELTLPEGLQYIGASCFRGIGIDLVIPPTVTTIGGNSVDTQSNAYQFSFNYAGSKITFLNPEPITNWKTSSSNYKFGTEFTIYVPNESLEAYREAWSVVVEDINQIQPTNGGNDRERIIPPIEIEEDPWEWD